MILFRMICPEFVPAVQIPAPRLETPELPATPVIVKPSMTTLFASIWNAPLEVPTIDSDADDRPQPEIPACAPLRVTLFAITTSSGYVPGSTRTVSPIAAAPLTAAWI